MESQVVSIWYTILYMQLDPGYGLRNARLVVLLLLFVVRECLRLDFYMY